MINSKILRAIFEGYNVDSKSYSKCILLFKESNFSISWIYKTILENGFLICSYPKIDMLIEERCRVDEDFWKAYLIALKNNYSFTQFSEPKIENVFRYNIPRFSESDFLDIISKIGGNKIQESNEKTPDFLIDKIVIELKDLQIESLYEKNRQAKIAEVLGENSDYAIDLNISLKNIENLPEFKRIISNSIKNQVKKASTQIKAYKEKNEISNAGLILLNTGYFSLSHKLLKSIVEDIIQHQTQTIEFAYIFTQTLEINSIGDQQANYYQNFIGNVPEKIKNIEKETTELIDQKMSSIFQKLENKNFVQAQEPISFLSRNKIFYWKPTKLKPSWEVKYKHCP